MEIKIIGRCPYHLVAIIGFVRFKVFAKAAMGLRTAKPLFLYAGVAKSADAPVLETGGLAPCGFKSRPRHHYLNSSRGRDSHTINCGVMSHQIGSSFQPITTYLFSSIGKNAVSMYGDLGSSPKMGIYLFR